MERRDSTGEVGGYTELTFHERPVALLVALLPDRISIEIYSLIHASCFPTVFLSGFHTRHSLPSADGRKV